MQLFFPTFLFPSKCFTRHDSEKIVMSLGSMSADHQNHIQQGRRNFRAGWRGTLLVTEAELLFSGLTVWPARDLDPALLGYPYSVSKLAVRWPEQACGGSALLPGPGLLGRRAGASRSQLGLWVLPPGFRTASRGQSMLLPGPVPQRSYLFRTLRVSSYLEVPCHC